MERVELTTSTRRLWWLLLKKPLQFIRRGSYERWKILVWLAFARFPRQMFLRWLTGRKQQLHTDCSELQEHGVSRIQIPAQSFIEYILDDAKKIHLSKP